LNAEQRLSTNLSGIVKGLMDHSSFWKLTHRKAASKQIFMCVLGMSGQPGMVDLDENYVCFTLVSLGLQLPLAGV
jgi:hypothetical protein